MPKSRLSLFVFLWICPTFVALWGAEPEKQKVNFTTQIRPILSEHCFQCHGPDEKERKGGVRLDLREGAYSQGDSGEEAIVPHKPDESELIARIMSTDETEMMPPASLQKPLTAIQKDLLKRWISEGASYQMHWAFAAPEKIVPPNTTQGGWVRNGVDPFVLARLEKEGMSPSPEADRRTLIRRVTQDLTGLPPTPGEVAEFLADSRPDAYEHLVERLLRSPHYGERMAIDWLDAARYADTHGYHIDSGRDMTRWREYVMDSFTNNRPFDQFILEQLAGDLLPNATVEQQIASGFQRNHMINYEGGAIPEEYHNAYIVDRVNTFGTVFLGMSISCGQCHDHKYDPFTQKEYYQLYSYFHNVPENGLDGRKGNAPPYVQFPTNMQTDRRKELDAAIVSQEEKLSSDPQELADARTKWEQEVTAQTDANGEAKPPEEILQVIRVPVEERTPEQTKKLRDYYAEKVSPLVKQWREELKKLKDDRQNLEYQIPSAMVMQEMAEPRETFVLVRGQYDKKGEKVTAAVPSLFPPLPEGAPNNRLGLARWLLTKEHPLTARVMVNRYWQLFFGTGLVKTTEEFGSQGDLPSHPELLDWLAVRFREGDESVSGGKSVSGWNSRELVRLLVTSATYRQSSRVTQEAYDKDPENRLLGRMSRLRLGAEFSRDQALATSGLLNYRIGGLSVSPYQPTGIWEELTYREDNKNFSAQIYAQDHGSDLYRRTMYTFWKRTAPPPTLVTFDAPDRETCTVKRARTNTPLQALILMNDPTYVEAHRKLAERILQNGGVTVEERIEWLFQRVLSRSATERELTATRGILDRQLARYQQHPEEAAKLLSVGESPRNTELNDAELAAWSMTAGTILNLDEAISRN